ncbi:hypothetical protein COLO4_26817 [Corchorus olitorius]|uniref:Uncharacterized protein n=1 Tax=Corchorus olitorius TaxID=93759 RepID=A0A1R3HUE9_9ROSI|nr:hypothetical protein COLO4_26817 [Corchorus olitorius]
MEATFVFHKQQNGLISKSSHSKASYCNSGSQLDTIDEVQSYSSCSSSEVSAESLLSGRSYNEETGTVESCFKSSDSYPYRCQLEQDAQELLSHIAVLEVTISKLEKEMVSLHYQLSQERNERRLAEYRLRHSSSPSNAADLLLHLDGKKMSAKTDGKSCQPLPFEKISRGIPPKGLWDHPNQLSEEMVRCMRNIFISLADSATPSKSSAFESHSSTLSPRGHLSNSSWWSSSERSMIPSWVQSPQIDIQSNSEVLAAESSFDPYRAYLAYGVPRSDLKLFSLMQKALLLALHKLKVSDEQRKSAIDAYEPLVSFALSSGMYSSPAVRIYSAKNVREELEEAQRDFIRASVGVSSKGKLLVPKLLHCFAKGFVDDSNLAVWISHYLPPHQAAFVEQCISQRRQSLLGSRNCGILPFDSRFRYLFLPDKISVQ